MKEITFKTNNSGITINIPTDILVHVAENHPESPLKINDPIEFAKQVTFQLENNLEDFEIIKPDDVEIFKVNIEDELVLAKKYGVKKLPTLIYFKDGKPIKEDVGIKTSQELLDSSKKDFK